MSILRVAISVAVLILSATPVHGEANANKIIEILDAGGQNATITTFWLSGVENGTSWVNATLFQKGQKRLYCVPSTLSLTHDQTARIFRDFVKANPIYGSAPAGMVMLHAMVSTFPCE